MKVRGPSICASQSHFRQRVAVRGVKVCRPQQSQSWENDPHRRFVEGTALQAIEVMQRSNLYIPYSAQPEKKPWKMMPFEQGFLVLAHLGIRNIFNREIRVSEQEQKSKEPPGPILNAFNQINFQVHDFASDEFGRIDPQSIPHARAFGSIPHMQISIAKNLGNQMVYHALLVGFYYTLLEYAPTDRAPLIEKIDQEIDRFRLERIAPSVYSGVNNALKSWFVTNVDSAIEFVEGTVRHGCYSGAFLHAAIPNSLTWTDVQVTEVKDRLERDAKNILDTGAAGALFGQGVPVYRFRLYSTIHRRGKNQQLYIGLFYADESRKETIDRLLRQWRLDHWDKV